MTNDSWLLVTLQAVYQHMQAAEPHISRQRVRELYEERMRHNAAKHDGRNSYVNAAPAEQAAEKLPMDDPNLMAVVAGWNDRVTGRAYQDAYAKAPKGTQENYEMGRSMAAACSSVQQAPFWPPNRTWGSLIAEGVITEQALKVMAPEHQRFTKDMEDAENRTSN